MRPDLSYTVPFDMFVDISPPVSGLFGNLCATALYGVYIVVFSACVYVLFQRRLRGSRVPWFLLVTAIAQFLVSTIHIANGWQTLLEGFISNAHKFDDHNFWVNPSISTTIIRRLVIILNSCIADAALVWRLYMIWNKNLYVCILPSVMVVAYAATYFVGIRQLAYQTGVNSTDPTATVASQLLLVGLALALMTNLLVTCLIAGKIWVILHNNLVTCGSPVSNRCTAVVRMILESGVIYGFTMMLLVAFTATGTEVGCFVSNIFVQLCGIIPALTIVYVGPGLTADRPQVDAVPLNSGQNGEKDAERYEILHYENYRKGLHTSYLSNQDSK